MGKFLWEGREKGLPCWLSQFSKTKLRQPTGQNFFLPSQRNFPISFKPKVVIAKFIWKMQKISGVMKSGLDAMPLFLLDDLLREGRPPICAPTSGNEEIRCTMWKLELKTELYFHKA